MDRTIMDSKVVSGIMDFNERKAKMTEKNIEVLDKVKEILTLGNTDLMTVQMVADYYEVNKNTIEVLIKRNKKELEDNGLKVIKGKEMKEVFGTYNMSVASKRWGFECEGQNFNNRSNIILTKRTLLNIGMLLRDSKVAQELRRRILDIVYDAEEGNGSIETVVNEINEEMKLLSEKALAEYNGDYAKVSEINAKLFDIKNRKIADQQEEIEDLSNTIKNSITIKEMKDVINRAIRKIASQKYQYSFGSAWNDFYSILNYKMGINVKSRDKKDGDSWLSVLNEEELKQAELMAKSWAKELGVDIGLSLVEDTENKEAM